MRRRRALNRNHRIKMVGFEQRIEYCRVHRTFGTPHRHIGQRRIGNGNALRGKIGNHLRRRRHHFDTGQAQTVDYHRRSAAGHRDHGHAFACGRLVTHHQLRSFEQGLKSFDTDDTVVAEKSIGDIIGTGNGAGVCGGNFTSHRRPPQLEGNHRFARSKCPACGFSQTRRITEGFQKQQDTFGVRIIDHAVDQLADTDITFIAQRHQFRKTKSALLRAGDDRPHHRSAL